MNEKEIKITDGIEVIVQYRTSDDKLFNDLEEANKHQEELNNFDYKKGYFELLQEVEELRQKQRFMEQVRRFNEKQPFPVGDAYINGNK